MYSSPGRAKHQPFETRESDGVIPTRFTLKSDRNWRRFPTYFMPSLASCDSSSEVLDRVKWK